MFGAREAEAIAQKLDAPIEGGRKHARVNVRLNGVHVGSYGIRRGTNVGHDYIPRQIQATTRQALDLARCPLSKQGFIEILVQRGVLPPG